MEEKPGYTRLPNGNWMTPYGEQGESGFDINQLRENLRLTPTERMEKAQRAILFFEELINKSDKLRTNSRPKDARRAATYRRVFSMPGLVNVRSLSGFSIRRAGERHRLSRNTRVAE